MRSVANDVKHHFTVKDSKDMRFQHKQGRKFQILREELGQKMNLRPGMVRHGMTLHQIQRSSVGTKKQRIWLQPTEILEIGGENRKRFKRETIILVKVVDSTEMRSP